MLTGKERRQSGSVACLHKDGSRAYREESVEDGDEITEHNTSKLAHQAFSRSKPRNNTTGSYTLDYIVTVPCNKVTIVNDVLFSCRNLQICQARYSPKAKGVQKIKDTHILPDDGTQATEPQNSSARDAIREPALAGKHHLAEILSLEVLDDALCASEERVLADVPRLAAGEAHRRDVAQAVRRQDDLAGPGVVRHGDVAAGDQLLHAELDLALDRHGRRHGDHGARLGVQRRADRQLDRHDGVGVAVADAVRAAVELAHVVDVVLPRELRCWWSPACYRLPAAAAQRGL